MSSINIAKMNLFKIFTITLISTFFSGFIYADADSDRDTYIALEKRVKELRAQYEEERSEIKELEASPKYASDEEMRKLILSAMRDTQAMRQKEIDSKMKEMERIGSPLQKAKSELQEAGVELQEAGAELREAGTELQKAVSDTIRMFERLRTFTVGTSKKINTFMKDTSRILIDTSNRFLGINPSEGDPSEGDPSEGDPSEGNPSEGNPSEGNPPERAPSEWNPSEGGSGSYIAKSIDEYTETCRGAFDCLDKFSPELSQLGRDVDEILSFYTRLSMEAADKNGKFTLGTFRLQRAYVAFKKVVKACALKKPELIGPYPVADGVHTEFSPILGIKADSMESYSKFIKLNPEFLRFGNSLYFQNPNCPGSPAPQSESGYESTSMTMLPKDLKDPSDTIALEKLNDYLARKKLKPSQVVFEDDFVPGVTHTYDIDNEWSDWRLQVVVDPSGAFSERFSAYAPSSVIALHELCHVEHILPGESGHQPTAYTSSVDEIPCVIDQIILQDEIYKKVKGISIQEEVKYKNPTRTNNGGGLNAGLIANTFRNLKNQHGGDVLKALMSDEGKKFVRTYFDREPKCQSSLPKRANRMQLPKMKTFLDER